MCTCTRAIFKQRNGKDLHRHSNLVIQFQTESEDGITDMRLRDLEEFRREKLKRWTRDSYAFE